MMLLGSLLARSLIAPGFMPAGSGAGAILELCHMGLAPAAIERLFADSGVVDKPNPGRHHHHGHHATSTNAEPIAPGPPPDDPLTHDQLCPLGNALSGLYTLPHVPDWIVLIPAGHLEALKPTIGKSTPEITRFLARAPPIPRHAFHLSGL